MGKSEDDEHVQTKLTVGPASDRYEREADRAASQAVSMTDASVRERSNVLSIQRVRSSENYGVTSPDIELSGAGQPLSPSTRAYMEPRFGADFGNVRVHRGPKAYGVASQVNARAFTYGSHVWLGQGERESDRGLIAHELTHVVQQGGATTSDNGAGDANLGENSMGQQDDGFLSLMEALHENDEIPGDVEPDIEFLFATNGTTTCSFPSGTATSNVTNTECSRTCTSQHEAKHREDIGPCCGKAGETYRAATTDADRATVRRQFFTWMGGNRRYFECRAYAVSVSCADSEMASKNCDDPAEGDEDCCNHLQAYRTDKEARRVSNCAGNPTLSACPFA